MKHYLLAICLMVLSLPCLAQESTAEYRNPAGYEINRLYYPRTTISQRVPTYSDVVKSATGDPKFFIVDNDETTGLKDAIYFWSGIEIRLLSLVKTTVTKVSTRAQMVVLCKPGIPRRFIVAADELEQMTNTVYEWDGNILLWTASIYDPLKQP
jgi:hypothetical protein